MRQDRDSKSMHSTASKWHLGAQAAVWAVTLGVCATNAHAAEREFKGPPLKWVRKSTERIEGDFLSVKKMPKTISIDPMTPAEILQTQRLIYNEVMRIEPNVNDSWMRASGACMQWIFLRHQPNEPWQTISTKGGGAATLLKINGAFWASFIGYDIPHGSKTSGWLIQMTEQVPGPGPGKGGMSAIMFGRYASPEDAWERRQGVERRRFEARQARLPDWVFSIDLLGTKDLRVADSEVPCTHLAAKCRRYVGTVERRSRYAYLQEAGLPYAEGLIELDPSLNTEVAIEDMCPFAFMALVQRPLNGRLSGGTGLPTYSFKGNPGLPGALRPFVEGEKK